jgi:hypothetical protein
MSISNMDKIINNTVKDTINDIITEVEEEEVLLEIKL